MTTLKQYEINRYSRILGYGAARGEVIVPNDDIVEAINSSDEWIRQRTGIVTRHRASAEVGVKDLALTAGREAVERSGIAIDEGDRGLLDLSDVLAARYGTFFS